MPAIATLAGGNAMSSVPDVCQTPTPIGTLPIPYVNTGMNAQGDTGTLTEKVKVVNAKVFIKTSKISMSNGDQAGSSNGVVSGKIMGPVKFTMGATKVRCEGSPAIIQGSLTTHNGNTPNTIGVQASVAQAKVSAL